jgi:hypothetical protein
MALPSSGPISMSMVNIEIGDDFNQGVSFESIAADFNLSAPNYGDSKLGLGLDELYGLSPSLTAVFSDFSVTSFTVNSQDGLITSQPQAQAGSDPLVSLTIDYVGDPFSLVLADITRTADIDLTVPAESAVGNPYSNQGSTLSGQVTSTQNPYQFEFDDWTGGIGNINPNTGIVSFVNGNDSNAPSVVTSNTNFTKVSTLPAAGEYLPSATSFGVLSSQTTRTVTFTIGVPGGNQNGSGGAYGNQGTTVTGTDSITQYPTETISTTQDSNPLTWTNSQNINNKKSISIDVGGGTGTPSWSAIVREGHTSGSGGVSTTNFEITTVQSSSTSGSFSAGNSGDDVLYVYPVKPNTGFLPLSDRVSISLASGGISPIEVLLQQAGNVTFTTSPSPAGGATIDVTYRGNGTVESGDNTIGLTTNPSPNEIDYIGSITGSSAFLIDGGTADVTGTGNKTFTLTVPSNTGAGRTATFNIDATTAGVTGVLNTYNLKQKAAIATGNIKYSSAVLSISIGAFGTTYTVQNSSGNPSPAFLDMRVVGANYAVSYQASIATTTYAGLSSTFDSSGGGSGLSSFNGTASTDATGATQFYVNMKTNSTTGDNTFTLTFTFDDDTTATTTDIGFTVEGISGGGGGDDGGGGGGDGVPPAGGCLIYGTQVSMMDGTTKEIQNLVIGDIVKSINIDTMADGESESLNWSSDTLSYTSAQSEVVGNTEYSVDTIYSFNEGLIEASIDHNHFIKRNNTHMFLSSDNIQVGDYFLNDEDVFVEITSIEQNSDSNNFVYKLDVESKDLFFANGIVTHNAKGGEEP